MAKRKPLDVRTLRSVARRIANGGLCLCPSCQPTNQLLANLHQSLLGEARAIERKRRAK